MPAGRPRKPITVKIMEGSYRADRDGPKDSLVIADGTPLPPKYLKGEALRCWQAIVPGLVERKVAAECDSFALAGMCEWWARYRKVSRKLDAVKSAEDTEALSRLASLHWQNFDRIASGFGLKPSDRARLRIEGASKPKGVTARKRG